MILASSVSNSDSNEQVSEADEEAYLVVFVG